jgi:hypothetical protein
MEIAARMPMIGHDDHQLDEGEALRGFLHVGNSFQVG